MTVCEDVLTNLKVVKRNGKKVDFDGTKIAMAIKKGFDNINRPDDHENVEERIYNEKDIQKVFQSVIKRIEKDYKEEEKIKIEDIQDMIKLIVKKELNLGKCSSMIKRNINF